MNLERKYADEMLADVRAEVLPNLSVAQRAAAQADYLRALNAELVAALQAIADGKVMSGDWSHADTVLAYQELARKAIAKAQS